MFHRATSSEVAFTATEVRGFAIRLVHILPRRDSVGSKITLANQWMCHSENKIHSDNFAAGVCQARSLLDSPAPAARGLIVAAVVLLF